LAISLEKSAISIENFYEVQMACTV
jgi:hypothetical protein